MALRIRSIPGIQELRNEVRIFMGEAVVVLAVVGVDSYIVEVKSFASCDHLLGPEVDPAPRASKRWLSCAWHPCRV